MGTLTVRQPCVKRTRAGIAAHRSYLATCPRYIAALEDLETCTSRIASVQACKRGLSRTSKWDRCQRRAADEVLEDLLQQAQQLLATIKVLDGREDPSDEGLEDLDDWADVPF